MYMEGRSTIFSINMHFALLTRATKKEFSDEGNETRERAWRKT
jgi:hypothetical protein